MSGRDRVAVTVRLDASLLERARDLAWRDRRTLNSVFEAALSEYFERHGPIEPRGGQLTPGRPVR